MLERLRKQRDEMRARLTELRGVDDRDLTNDELAEVDKILRELPPLAERVSALEEADQREERLAQAQAASTSEPVVERASAPAQVTSEPETYRKGGQRSFFRDLAVASVRGVGAGEAGERLVRNAREVAAAKQERALSTTDGAGGDFVPPLWMVNDYVNLARAARVTADLVRNLDLPVGTDSISLPRLATGTAVAEQATQNSAVQNTDATTNSVTANVKTLAGQQVVPLQLIEQSPVNMDEVLLADLAADYSAKLDLFVINNSATNANGLLNVTGINAVTYTDASPTVAEIFAKVADAIQQVSTGRFLPATAIVMHPRRWAWFVASLDASSRPLVGIGAGAQNPLANGTGIAAEGMVGNILGLPVYVDPNIPTNLGAGTNEDRIIIMRADDVILYEGTPRSEAFRETKADQLSVLLRFYNYAALHSARYPKSVSVIAGTGLATPTF